MCTAVSSLQNYSALINRADCQGIHVGGCSTAISIVRSVAKSVGLPASATQTAHTEVVAVTEQVRFQLSQSTYTHVKLSLADNQQYLYESAATAVAAAKTVSHQCMASVAQ